MIYINNESTDPYFNLALEEYLLKHTALEAFMLWRNDRTIVVGKNQNTAAEINGEYVRESGVKVVRRMTGGGAVYHDMGNINFTFIAERNGEGLDFGRFMEPVARVLRELGADAEVSGRNDILIDGRKVSGNSQTIYKDRVMHHGTLLFDADTEAVAAALKADDKIKSKGIPSVRSRVANIKDYITDPEGGMTAERFKDLIAQSLWFEEYRLTGEDISAAQRLADEKYSTWEWNYGESPKYSFVNKGRFAGGGVEVMLDVSGGIIHGARIYGDFFGAKDAADIELALRGARHNAEDIAKALAGYDSGEYFFNITKAELMSLFV